MEIKEQIDITRVPQHIAIIMDGNGRWAKQQGQERLFGHSFGVDSVRSTVAACRKVGVKYLTLYAFSTENWGRPKEEVDGLMELMVKTISNEVPELLKQNVRIHTIGDMDGLPTNCQLEMNAGKMATADNDGLHLILALNYSARWEMVEAMKSIANKIENKELATAEISEQVIAAHLTTASFPDPELLIRTSGELRLSNFLLWQSAYTEFFFTETLWPDFAEKDLYEAILKFQNRERRFGKTSEQIVNVE